MPLNGPNEINCVAEIATMNFHKGDHNLIVTQILIISSSSQLINFVEKEEGIEK